MKKEITMDQVRQDAEAIYSSGELSCSEAIVHSIIKNVDPTMPEVLIPTVSGFSVGVGGTQCMCSTVSASVFVLGYLFGRTFPTTITDPESLKTLELSLEVQEAFRENHKVSCCKVLRKGVPEGERPEKCIALVGDMAVMTAKIIARELKLQVVA